MGSPKQVSCCTVCGGGVCQPCCGTKETKSGLAERQRERQRPVRRTGNGRCSLTPALDRSLEVNTPNMAVKHSFQWPL